MKRAHPEATLQRAVYQFLSAALGEGAMFRMVENNPRSRIAGAMAKARGVRAGTPDALIWWHVPGDHFEDGDPPVTGFAAIELKSARGRQSLQQVVFQRQFESIGGRYAVCRTLDEVEAALRSWDVPMRITQQGRR